MEQRSHYGEQAYASGSLLPLAMRKYHRAVMWQETADENLS